MQRSMKNFETNLNLICLSLLKSCVYNPFYYVFFIENDFTIHHQVDDNVAYRIKTIAIKTICPANRVTLYPYQCIKEATLC